MSQDHEPLLLGHAEGDEEHSYISHDGGTTWVKMDRRYTQRQDKRLRLTLDRYEHWLKVLGLAELRGEGFSDVIHSVTRYVHIKHGVPMKELNSMTFGDIMRIIKRDIDATPAAWPTVTDAAQLLCDALNESYLQVITLSKAKARISKAANNSQLKSLKVNGRRRIDPRSLLAFVLQEREKSLQEQE